MAEIGLNIAAEILVEYSAYGRRVVPNGNRGPEAASQGVYQCVGTDECVAIPVKTTPSHRGKPILLSSEEVRTSPLDGLTWASAPTTVPVINGGSGERVMNGEIYGA
jgi:hypothetical protein